MSQNNPQQSRVTLHAGDDPEMEQAIRRARQTFRVFWREMAWEKRRIVPALDLSCVKVGFSDPPGQAQADHPAVEQMWINDVDFDGKLISGTLINSPHWLTSVKEGDHVEISPSRMSDWMYAIRGEVYGAYTVNLLRSKMSRGERAQHDAAWGLNFGNADEIRLVPPAHLEQKKPGFFGALFGGRNNESQVPEEVVAREHPMALNMTASLEEHVSKNPEAATEADERGFTLLHGLALAGAASGVRILLNHGANVNAPAKNGMTPLALAKVFGWENVIALLEAHASGRK